MKQYAPSIMPFPTGINFKKARKPSWGEAPRGRNVNQRMKKVGAGVGSGGKDVNQKLKLLLKIIKKLVEEGVPGSGRVDVNQELKLL